MYMQVEDVWTLTGEHNRFDTLLPKALSGLPHYKHDLVFSVLRPSTCLWTGHFSISRELSNLLRRSFMLAWTDGLASHTWGGSHWALRWRKDNKSSGVNKQWFHTGARDIICTYVHKTEINWVKGIHKLCFCQQRLRNYMPHWWLLVELNTPLFSTHQ